MLLASRPIPEFLSVENKSFPDLLDLHKKKMQLARRNQLILFQKVSCGSKPGTTLVSTLPESHAVIRILCYHYCWPHWGKMCLSSTLISFYWPHMRGDVEQFIASCLLCEQTKYLTKAPTGLLRPLPTPTLVWEEAMIDFYMGLHCQMALLQSW